MNKRLILLGLSLFTALSGFAQSQYRVLKSSNAAGVADYCTGTNSTLVFEAICPNPSGCAYQWDINGNITTDPTVSLDYAAFTVLSNQAISIEVTPIGGTSQGITTFTPSNSPIPNTPNILGNTKVCDGDPLLLTLSNPPSNTNPNGPFIKWSTGTNNTQVLQVPPGVLSVGGNYTVSVTVIDKNGCQNTGQIGGLGYLVKPTALITGGSAICNGASTTMTASSNISPVVFNWSTGENTSSISASSTGVYTVTISKSYPTNNANCFSVASRTVTTSNALDPKVYGLKAICSGNPAEVRVDNFNTIKWSTGSTSQNVSIVNPGRYFVTVSNSSGCTGNTFVDIVTSTKPFVDVNNFPTSVCSGQAVVIDAGAQSAYLWSTGATTRTIQVNSTGVYTVTAYNSVGCFEDYSTQPLTNAYAPLPQIVGKNFFCDGSTTSITTKDGYKSYVWSDNKQTTKSINIKDVGIYRVVVTDYTGCTGVSNAFNVSLKYPIALNLTTDKGNSNIVCAGSRLQLDASASYALYSWSTGETAQKISVKNEGIYTVTVTDGSSCKTTGSISVIVRDNPVPQLNNTSSICGGDPVVLSPTGNYVKYVWNTGATTNTISVTNPMTYIVTVTDVDGCKGSATKQMLAYSKPNAQIIGPNSGCQGSTIDLMTIGGFSQYLWNTGQTDSIITVSSTQNYSVTVVDKNGCSNSSNKGISFLAAPSVTLQLDDNVCQGDFATIKANGNFTSYLWSNGKTSPNITVSRSGTYAVTVYNAGGCSAVAVGDQQFKPLPIANYTSSPQGLTVYFLNQSQDATTYQWTFDDGTPVDNTENPIHTFSGPRLYKVTLTALNSCGASTFEQNLNVKTASIAAAKANTYNVFPNPSNGIVEVKGLKSSAAVVLYDLLGNKVYENKQHEVGSKLDFSEFSSGMYLLQIKEVGHPAENVRLILK